MAQLIEVRRLKKHFLLSRSFFSRKKMEFVHAVDGVNFDIFEKETVALVGESGCGKTTIGRLVLRLIEPTAGSVLFGGRNIFDLNKKEMLNLRRKIQIINQDPFASLNPRKTVCRILGQPFDVHKIVEKKRIKSAVSNLLELVGLSPVEKFLNRYPHELSGGQRQRIGIARALATNPNFIVADEPVSSLDVSIRSQILNLLKRLQKNFDLSMLFITHDLSLARFISQRIIVMYLGKIVELAKVDDFYRAPIHPYSIGLLSAKPVPNPRMARSRKMAILKGEVSSNINVPSGCRFHPRCPLCTEICFKEEPEAIELNKGHLVACHNAN
jgi:oligopeptide/dipeptide ABC transporter ATP-binding protein